MRFINRIRTLFTFRGKKEEMEVTAAKVDKNGVLLCPVEDPEHSFFIKASTVDIVINSDAEIEEDDIEIKDRKSTINPENEGNTLDGNEDEREVEVASPVKPQSLSKFLPRKRRFTVLLYQDEYDMLMKNITANGYKKTEYFLACMTSAKKNCMGAEYKKYTDEHKKRRISDLNMARQARADDYALRKSNNSAANPA